jgi:signal transduction histidine kinase
MKFLFSIVSLLLFLATVDHGLAQMQSTKFNRFVGTNGIVLGKIGSMIQDKFGFMLLSDQDNACIYKSDGRNIIRFKKKLETDLDPLIGKINVAPEDIGRVMLNLINNAFCAVSQRKLIGPGGEHREPTVALKSKKVNNKVVVSVTDNGTGIPENVLDKIFQPFFTTKPAGEGTGLGLSLSYDIITKGRNGELKVDTAEGKGTTFTIILPV